MHLKALHDRIGASGKGDDGIVALAPHAVGINDLGRRAVQTPPGTGRRREVALLGPVVQ